MYKRSRMSINELVREIEQGARARKLWLGLTREQYGHIYSIGGYRFFVEGDISEIERRVKEARRARKRIK